MTLKRYILPLSIALFPLPALAAEPVPSIGANKQIETAGRIGLASASLRRAICLNLHHPEQLAFPDSLADDLEYFAESLRYGALETGLLPLAHAKSLEKLDAVDTAWQSVTSTASPDQKPRL